MLWLLYIILFLFLLAGFVINALTLPGNWLMIAAAAIYACLTHSRYIGWHGVLFLTALALIAEIIDTLAGGAGAKRAGASRRGKWGSLLGGLLGGLFLSFLIPIPLVGTIAGILLGCFAGAALAELTTGRTTFHALRIGGAAAVGRLAGMCAKIVFSAVIFLAALVMSFPHRLH